MLTFCIPIKLNLWLRLIVEQELTDNKPRNVKSRQFTIRFLPLIYPEAQITLGIPKFSNVAFLHDNSPLLSFRPNLLLSPSARSWISGT